MDKKYINCTKCPTWAAVSRYCCRLFTLEERERIKQSKGIS